MASKTRNTSDQGASATPRAWTRPIVALFVLAILAMANFALVQWQLDEDEVEDRLIVETSRLAILGSGLMHDAARYVEANDDAPPDESLRGALLDGAHDLRTRHAALVHDVGTNSSIDQVQSKLDLLFTAEDEEGSDVVEAFSFGIEELVQMEPGSFEARSAWGGVEAQGLAAVSGYEEMIDALEVARLSHGSQLREIGFVLLSAQVVGLFVTGLYAMAPLVSRMEAEVGKMEALNRELDERVRRRTADLEGKTRELERSNEQLETFASVASHDLQEPLRMVTSYLQLFERRYQDIVDDEGREYIAFAVDGAERMKILINDLLQFSRVGRQEAHLEPIDLNAVLEQVRAQMTPALESSGAALRVGALPTVLGIEGELVQLFQNLVQNALKYRSAKGPEVDVEATHDGGTWQVVVKDNGVGVAPRFHKKIFEIFERLDATSSVSGTGIGLAICKKIVERHDGQIWIESEEGDGATFHIELQPVPEVRTDVSPIEADKAAPWGDVARRSRELV